MKHFVCKLFQIHTIFDLIVGTISIQQHTKKIHFIQLVAELKEGRKEEATEKEGKQQRKRKKNTKQNWEK